MSLIKSKFSAVNNAPHVAGKSSTSVAAVDEPLDIFSCVHIEIIPRWTSQVYDTHINALPECERSTVMKMMDKLDKWDYDVWAVQDFTEKGSLFYTAYALFIRLDFIRRFSIDEHVVINFFSQVEAGYHPTPFHNSMHGADVMHAMHYICLNEDGGGLKAIAKLTDADILAALIAGAIHDFDHPGPSNSFQISTQSYLATLYNDRNILENHSCAEVFAMIQYPSLDILGSLSESDRTDVRETVIDMVLSTNMGMHAYVFTKWKRRIGVDHDLYKRKDDQRLALSIAMKVADVCNCLQPETMYLKWCHKLAEQFFLRGDIERNFDRNVSPFCDRYYPSMAKSQIAFMNYIVIPLTESFAEFVPAIHFVVDFCESNKSYWSENDDSL
jgi:3',5'-cyclic-nucleotide phosphodiesterase